MYGKVIAFSNDLGAGYLVCQNGTHYNFFDSEWRAANPPRVELTVEFDIVNGEPVNIH